MTTDQKLQRDTLNETCARVLADANASEDAKTVAEWATKMLAWLRAQARKAEETRR
jgi:hypothetical protein